MELTKKATELLKLQNYAPKTQIEGVKIIKLKRFNDDGGSFTELARMDNGMFQELPDIEIKQINYSEMDINSIKAFHLHKKQSDIWFVPHSEKILLTLIDLRKSSSTKDKYMRIVMGDSNSFLVYIPPGVAHGCKNISNKIARIIYFNDQHFSADPDKCDEGRLPWDYLGKEIWDITKE